jgi:PAS domain S-box-containing protein
MNDPNGSNTDNTQQESGAIVRLKRHNEPLQQTHASQEKSSDHYRDLFDFAPSGYLALNDDGVIVECNYAAANLLGVEQKKLAKKRFARFVADADKELWNWHCLLAKQSRSNRSCALSVLRDNGIPLYVQLNCTVKQTTDGLTFFLVTLNDISAFKQADEALRIAAVAFETQDGIVVTDANKVILRTNEAFKRITGYSAEDTIKQTIAIISLGQHDQNHCESTWSTVMNDGYWQGETLEKRKDGKTFPAWLTLTAVVNKEGCVSHYVCSLTDITAQKQAEKILLENRYRLENQVTTTKEELEKVKKETAEINAAITVLLKYQESNKAQSQQALYREVEETILPFLKKLKGASTGRVQSSKLLGVIETNLLQLVSTYGRTGPAPAALRLLTPLETQVASMVKQGLPTKSIANTLRISEGTVSIHRNHIRKKLGLNKTPDNLQTYLKTLLD